MTAPPQPLHAVTTDVNRTESWQWHRVLAVVEQCAARRFVASVFEHRRGAHRVLTTEAFLAADALVPGQRQPASNADHGARSAAGPRRNASRSG